MNRASRYSGSATFLAFVRVVIVAFYVCVCHRAQVSDGKVFERCELAQVLRYGHGLDVNDVANWVCIAQHSSSLNTSAYGGNARSGGSHGLFQISDQYWCSPPGKGVACGVTCDRLRDDDISDDLACVQTIYEEHQRLSGDGYNAWIAYQSFCRDNPYEYVEDCFGNEEREYLHSKTLAANVVEDEEEDDSAVYSRRRGKVYGRCELAKELFLKHKMPMEEIPTWVCIAQHESNYDTSAVGRLNADGSADHGLFQISDLYWCHHKGGRRKACGMPCSKLLDTDISDDVKCVKQIYKEHTRISGDGFSAWTVYNAHCRGNMAAYVRGCFDGIDVEEPRPSEEYRKAPTPARVKSTKPHGKVYEPCELAEELRTKHHVPEDQIATWVCIAKHESDYNTSAIGYGDHGLFQISDIYWCSPPGKGWACGLSCADLEDSDITDDVECIRKIYNEHTRLTGDGFNAWTVYPLHCSQDRSAKYIAHCSGQHHHHQPKIVAQSQAYTRIASPNSIAEYEPKRGKVYGRCELAKELLEKHDMDMDEIPTWVCIAHHESNFDTSAVGRLNTDGSADHGLFQISDLFWCSHKEGHRKACGLPCSKLLDNDISDDVRCVKQIHAEHTRISGDGFSAWTVYTPYCRDRTEQYIRGCFDGSAAEEDFVPPQRALSSGFVSKNKPKGKVFEECELAVELRDKHHVPKEQIATWVCIAQHQSGLNTSSSVSNVHGLFHISDEFWCSPPGKGQACELNCADLEDNDITDDVQCIQKIYQEHQRLFGDGFSAWVVYPQHCSHGRATNYIGHCPGFTSTTGSYGSQQGVIKTHPKLGGRIIEIPNQPVYSHEFQANPFLKHFEVVNSNVIAPTFTTPTVDKPTFDHVFNANPFLQHFDAVSSNTIFPSSTQTPLSKPTFNHEFNVNPFLQHYDTKSKAPPSAFFSTSEKFSTSASEEVLDAVQGPTQQPGLNTFSLNPFLRTISAGSAATTTPKPAFGGFSIKPSTPAPAFSGTSIRPTPTKTKAIGVKTYFPQNEEKAKNEAFKSLAQPYLPLSTQTPKANRLQTYTLNTLKNPFSTSTPFTTRVPWYQLNTLNSAKPIVKPQSTNGFFFNRETTTTTVKPFSVTSFPTAKPQVSAGTSVNRGAATSTQTTTLRPVTGFAFSTVKTQGASFNRAVVSPVQKVSSQPFSAFSTSSAQGFSGFSSNRGVSFSTQTTTLKPVPSLNRTVTQATTTKPFSVFLSNTAKSAPSPSGLKAATPTVHTTTLRPISAGSYTTRAPQTSVKEDTGRYDPGRYDAGRYDSGRYDSGRYDSGRYDSGKYNPQTSVQTTSSPAANARTTSSSFGHYPTPTPTLRSRQQTTSKIGVTTLRPTSPVIALPHPSAQLQTSRFLSKFLSSEEDDSLPQASSTNEHTIPPFSISNLISGVRVTNVGNVGISVHKPAVTAQISGQKSVGATQNVAQSLPTPSLPADVIRTSNLGASQLTGSSLPFQVGDSLLPGTSNLYISPSFTSKRDTTASAAVGNLETAKDSSQISDSSEMYRDSSQTSSTTLVSLDPLKESSQVSSQISETSKDPTQASVKSSDSSEASKDTPQTLEPSKTTATHTSPKDSDSSEVLTISSQKSSDFPESTITSTGGKGTDTSSQTEVKQLSSINPTPVDSSEIPSSSAATDEKPISSSSSEPEVPPVAAAEQESSKPESESVKQPLNPSITFEPIPKTSSAFTAGSAKSPVVLNPTSTAASQTTKSSFRHVEALTPTHSLPTAAIQSSTSESSTSISHSVPSSVPSLRATATKQLSSSAQSSTLRQATSTSQGTPSGDSRPVMATTIKHPGATPIKVSAATRPFATSSATRATATSRSAPSSKARPLIKTAAKQPPPPSITPKLQTATRSSPASQTKPTQWSWSRPTFTSTSSSTPASAKTSSSAIKLAATFPARPVPTPTLKKSDISSVKGSAQPTALGVARLPSRLSSQQSASKTSIKPAAVSPATSSKSSAIFTSKPSPNQPSRTGTAKPSSLPTSKPSPNQFPRNQHSRTATSTGSSRSTRSITASSSSTGLNEPNSIIVTKPIHSAPARPTPFAQTSAVKSSPTPIIKTRASSLITPTKSQSLFSTNLNIYDFYSKLYGSYPPTKTSSAQPAASKTRQISVAPSRTS